jgi:hypothetical protein
VRGWSRIDPRPWRKLNACWEHRAGWRLEHCGHPTANWPWALFAPGGEMVLTGVRSGNPTHGRAWPDLKTATDWVAKTTASERVPTARSSR